MITFALPQREAQRSVLADCLNESKVMDARRNQDSCLGFQGVLGAGCPRCRHSSTGKQAELLSDSFTFSLKDAALFLSLPFPASDLAMLIPRLAYIFPSG